jgi:hypothetical protein
MGNIDVLNASGAMSEYPRERKELIDGFTNTEFTPLDFRDHGEAIISTGDKFKVYTSLIEDLNGNKALLLIFKTSSTRSDTGRLTLEAATKEIKIISEREKENPDIKNIVLIGDFQMGNINPPKDKLAQDKAEELLGIKKIIKQYIIFPKDVVGQFKKKALELFKNFTTKHGHKISTAVDYKDVLVQYSKVIKG